MSLICVDGYANLNLGEIVSVHAFSSGDRLHADVAELVADYKFRGIDRQDAYSQFVRDRSLKPEIDNKKFGVIYNSVSAKPFQGSSELITGNLSRIVHDGYHIDAVIIERGPSLAGGFVKWVGIDGSTGTDQMDYINGILMG